MSQLQRAPILLFCSFQVLNRLSCALERVDDFYFSFLISVILSSKAPAQAHSNTVLREVNGLFKILDKYTSLNHHSCSLVKQGEEFLGEEMNLKKQ